MSKRNKGKKKHKSRKQLETQWAKLLEAMRAFKLTKKQPR